MKILIIGSGGREHSIGMALKKSRHKTTLFFAPGNAGTSQIGQNIPILDTQLNQLCTFAKNEAIQLTIVGPETPLILGITDLFESEGLSIIGPNKLASQLEGSKTWAKEKMKAYGIPTAQAETFTSYENAIAYLKKENTYPIVIKADGLAAGKGVTVAQSFSEAENALKDCFIHHKFNEAGHQVIIEEFMPGEEASVFALCDGHHVLVMQAAQDHKQINDHDKGPNTGGMGAYSPAPIASHAQIQEQIQKQVFEPLIKGFKKDKIVYKGIIFAGLMIHQERVKVVEFNARFGDPETQCLLPRLETDLLDLFWAIKEEKLSDYQLKFTSSHCVCVILSSKGYPDHYEKNKPIQIQENHNPHCHVIHAGTLLKNGELFTNGGRVMGICGLGHSLKEAIQTAYEGVNQVQFEGCHYRTDIGKKGLTLS